MNDRDHSSCDDSRRAFLAKVAPAGVALGIAGTAGATCSDLNGDGTVGFPDLLRVLSEWGPASCAKPRYPDFNFAVPSIVQLPLGAGPHAVEIHGQALSNGDGTVNGGLQVNWLNAPGLVTQLTFIGDALVAQTGPNTLELRSDDGATVLDLNGFSVPGGPVIQNAYDEWNGSPNPFDWSPDAVNVAAVNMLSATPNAADFTQIGLLSGAAAPGYICKIDCAIVGSLATLIIAVGCGAIVAGCAGATTVTIGGTAVPCAWALAVCAGGVFAGTGAAYDAWLNNVWS